MPLFQLRIHSGRRWKHILGISKQTAQQSTQFSGYLSSMGTQEMVMSAPLFLCFCRTRVRCKISLVEFGARLVDAPNSQIARGNRRLGGKVSHLDEVHVVHAVKVVTWQDQDVFQVLILRILVKKRMHLSEHCTSSTARHHVKRSLRQDQLWQPIIRDKDLSNERFPINQLTSNNHKYCRTASAVPWNHSLPPSPGVWVAAKTC